MKCLLTGLLMVSMAFAAEAGLNDGLVAWFDFESLRADGKVENKADAANPLTLAGGAVVEANAALGSSVLHLPGLQESMATFLSPAMTNQTISLWLRRGETDGWSTETDVSLLCVLCGWGSLRFHFSKSDLNMSVLGNNNETVASLGDGIGTRNVWTHFVFTFEETANVGGKSTVETRVYADGHLLVVKTATLTVAHGSTRTTTTTLGNFDPRRPILGDMDEIRAWNRALTAEEAAAEFVRASSGKQAVLVGYWSMDEIVTDAKGVRTTPDLSGNGNDMTLGADVADGETGVEGGALKFVDSATSIGTAVMKGTVFEATYACWIRPKKGSSATAPRLWAGSDEYRVNSADDYASTVVPRGCGAMGLNNTTQPYCLEKGEWSHVALVIRHKQVDGANLADVAVYVNARKAFEKNDVASTVDRIGANATLYFCNLSTATSRPFEGLADEVRVYKRALGDEEIAKLYAGAAKVRAGGDFSTTAAETVLHGEVDSTAGDPLRTGYAGDVKWSLVSAPVGGEGVTFGRAKNPETEVTLPVAGDYTFRLSVTADGFVRTDDVTVTRLASAEGTLPTVTATAQAEVTLPLKGWVRADCTDAAARLWWTKKSGPGGVWFERLDATTSWAFFSTPGTYVLTASAENGAGVASADVTVSVAAASGETVALDSSLERFWGFNDFRLYTETVKGTTYSSTIDGANYKYIPGARMFGVRPLQAFTALVDTGADWETKDGGNIITSPDWMSVSLWMCYDPESSAFAPVAPFLVSRHQAYALRYGVVAYEQGDVVEKGPGLTLLQQGQSGQTVGLTCDFEGLAPVTGRWVHVAAVWDRTGGVKDNFEIWVDGVRRPLATVTGYATFPRPGRTLGNSLGIGGLKYGSNYYLPSNNGLFANATNSVAGGYRSAVFPGGLDEVRFYSRKLNAAEIRALANEFDAKKDFAPFIEDPGSVTTLAKAPVPVSVGVTASDAATASWSVRAGEADKVALSDWESPSTVMTFGRKGDYTLGLAVSDGVRTTYSAPLKATVEGRGTIIIFR